MRLYYEEAGVRLYCGDAREVCKHIDPQPEAVITDPVWPNSVFPDVADPQGVLNDALFPLWDVKRVVIQLGCDSDPRFLRAVPERWRFLRACWMEYSTPSYKGRILYTGDVAYVFGEPPESKPGAHVMPGRCVSSRSDKMFRRLVGRNKNQANAAEQYANLPHPSPRRLQHVRWLVKWFGGASVLDPFAGSGTTLLAAKDLGVPVTGIEIEERFCELAVERLRQGVLFHEEQEVA